MVTARRILLLSDIHVDRPGGHNVKALQGISGTAFLQDVLLVPGMGESPGYEGRGRAAGMKGDEGLLLLPGMQVDHPGGHNVNAL